MSMSKNKEQNEKKRRNNPWTKEDKDQLVELYPFKTNTELCEILNKSEGQIRGMKERMGLNKKFNPLTDDEKEKIKEFYENDFYNMTLMDFAAKLNRSETTISRYARKLGLTKNNRPLSRTSIEKLKQSLSDYRNTDRYINIIKPQQIKLLTYYAQNNHPKGMLNKHHREDVKERMSKAHIELAKALSYEEKHKIAMKAVETKRLKGGFNTTSNAYSRCKGGFRSDIGQYFRSSWEANIARVLNYLNIEWKYEVKRFDFKEEVEGVLSYQPDFYLPQYNKWIEVKGWMDKKSQIRLELFKQYYPIEFNNLILIDESKYSKIRQRCKDYISNWEYPRTEIEVRILKQEAK